MCKAGARKIVMDESLGREAGKESLNDSLLQVKLDYLIRHHPWIFEYHGAYGRSSAPFPEFLIAGAWCSEAVHSFGPCGICTLALVHGREDARAADPDRPVQDLSGSAPRIWRAQEIAERKWSFENEIACWEFFEIVLSFSICSRSSVLRSLDASTPLLPQRCDLLPGR